MTNDKVVDPPVRKLSLEEKITPHARVVLHENLGYPGMYCVEWGLGKIDHEQYFFTRDAAHKFYTKLCKSIGIKTRHDSNFDSENPMVWSRENYTICKIKRGYCVLWADNGNVCSMKFSNKEAAIACGEYQVSSIHAKNNSTKE